MTTGELVQPYGWVIYGWFFVSNTHGIIKFVGTSGSIPEDECFCDTFNDCEFINVA